MFYYIFIFFLFSGLSLVLIQAAPDQPVDPIREGVPEKTNVLPPKDKVAIASSLPLILGNKVRQESKDKADVVGSSLPLILDPNASLPSNIKSENSPIPPSSQPRLTRSSTFRGLAFRELTKAQFSGMALERTDKKPQRSKSFTSNRDLQVYRELVKRLDKDKK